VRVTVVEFAGRGGLMHYTFQLCRAMGEAGAEVTLVTDGSFELDGLRRTFRVEKLLRLWDAKPEDAPSASPAAAAWRKLRRGLRALRYYREWVRLALYLRRERPDVVQFGDVRFSGDLPFFWLLRLSGLRLADVCHNVLPFEHAGPSVSRSRLARHLYGRIYRAFGRVLVHFEGNRRLFLEAFPVEPERVAAIHHGNQEIFRELASPDVTPLGVREDLGLAPDDRVVLFFGTLGRYKGTDLLVEALPVILAAEPKACVVLAGYPLGGFDRKEHEALARSLGVEARLRLSLGYVPSEAVAAWMEMAEVVAFPYRSIFQSGALHLAQTFGRPIVATEVGAFPEAVRQGETGLLVPPGDPEALGQAVGSLLADPERARRLGEAAAGDARERFSWERAARIVLGEYEDLLGEARP